MTLLTKILLQWVWLCKKFITDSLQLHFRSVVILLEDFVIFEYKLEFEILFAKNLEFVTFVCKLNGIEIVVCAIGLADVAAVVVTVGLTTKEEIFSP